MKTTRVLRFVLCFVLIAATPLLAAPPVNRNNANDPVLYWNAVALQAVVEDHSGTFGNAEQGGPTRTSRALAIVHLAIFDAVNAIVGGYKPYIAVTGLPPETLAKASVEAAVAQAAHDTLVDLYPAQEEVFAYKLHKVLDAISDHHGRNEGIAVGAKAADNILFARVLDKSDDPNLPSPPGPFAIGEHRADPFNPGQGLLTPKWGDVRPFAMDDVVRFHAIAPPKPDSADLAERAFYAMNFDEVKRLGGDGIITPTERTAEQTDIGLFWGYDGSIGLGVPPRLYNQAARVIAQQERNGVAENARLFGLLNMAMADAGIASWYTKYEYKFWRPVVAIRAGGAGLLGDEDGNELTVGDPDWTPLGAPATNESNGGVDFTPPFPAYTSGHATFGAAAFRTLARLYDDDYKFQLMSDELSGRNTDSQGNHRRAIVRQFDSFSQAAEENALSRIYLGIHWRFDADEGIKAGNKIADYTYDHYLQPLP